MRVMVASFVFEPSRPFDRLRMLDWRQGEALAEKKHEFHYGGQAVIEGVMMRGPKDFAVAVRRTNGEITSTAENVESMFAKLKWLSKPFLRGTLMLIDAMALGIKALKVLDGYRDERYRGRVRRT